MAKLTVQFSSATSKTIKKFAQERGITQTELLRRAIALYIYAVNETSDGSRRLSITSAKEEEVIRDIILLAP